MTHVDFDVQVLQVERMLPNVNANDGDMGEERVLVSSGDYLKRLARRTVSLS